MDIVIYSLEDNEVRLKLFRLLCVNGYMGLHLLYDPEIRGLPARVACFMSGSGTNVTKIIKHQLNYCSLEDDCPYNVVLIFSDVKDERMNKEGIKSCFAKDISQSFKIPYAFNDIKDFYQSRGHRNTRNLSLRPDFDRKTLKMIDTYDIDIIALGGYMSIVTYPLLESFPGRIINVHPSDLSVREYGTRKYVGLHAVRDAILAGEKYLYSTTHIVRKKVDQGEILMRSKPVRVRIPDDVTLQELQRANNRFLLDIVIKENQNRLKEKGDWIIFPKTLEMIAKGEFSSDDRGNIYVDKKLVRNGFRL